ncbi:Serine/threonine protein kinase [Nakamurella panacisegetis]|uniref:non-specific serine/threonine protein kinase n=2 Tax=Nakamurella panacisegetis TaxID=1090615 RepID=A0A1H0QP07_9ACTN|nr:Serine/threonine protein kinase [Nakamurella panacisegetis]
MTVPGDVLAGRYRLIRPVATGGMGSVWEAWDELLQRRVAIKELLPQPGVSRDDVAMARSRVIREARITARLHHPHAVTLYDVIDHRGQPCLVLQYVPSRTLNSILAERGLLPIDFVTTVGAEVAAALAAAHQVGITHRDVKPSNILVTASGAALITDFGISHAAGDVSLTSTGMVTGTPAFLAPEVARGAPSGFPADVFSLGATLYAALEGTPPFGSDQNAMAILHKVASGQIIPPRRSGELTSLLVRMMAADPGARPGMATVARLMADLKIPPAPAIPPTARTDAVPPSTIRAWPADQDVASPDTVGGREGPGDPVPSVSPRVRGSRRQRVGVLLAVAAVLLAGWGTYEFVGGSRSASPSVGNGSVNSPVAGRTSQSSVPTSRGGATPTAGASPTRVARVKTTSAPASRANGAAPSHSPSPSVVTPTRRTASTRSTPPKPRTSSAASSVTDVPPSAAQLAAAITDYYALLPNDTDQGWARLTSNFQTGTAQNRQYYQRFWDSIQRVTATDPRGTGPDTAEATITYYFKDGRTAVESTVYHLQSQGGVLKIDSSTVLSSTTR